jgi:hypothetical protein
MARVFISYKRHANPDERLASHLVEHLREKGHRVFIDRDIEIGADWSGVIEREIQDCDHLIVLLSRKSVVSEMVKKEVEVAHYTWKRRGSPTILPVRVSFAGRLPYALSAYLDSFQDILWRVKDDVSSLGDLLARRLAEYGHQSASAPSSEVRRPRAASVGTPMVDGHDDHSSESLSSPLPSFDPDWLEQLNQPGGAVLPDSPFYIRRRADRSAERLLSRGSATILVKGARQMGKSSLLARLHQFARARRLPTLLLDFQSPDEGRFGDLDVLLHYLAGEIGREIKPSQPLDANWRGQSDPQEKLTAFMTEQVLSRGPILLLFDEVDRLFSFESCSERFFRLLRYWHNRRAYMSDPWSNLNLVLAYSTEARLFIKNPNESPFNVVPPYTLTDFDVSQMEELNVRHGSPLTSHEQVVELHSLLNGHPFLVRKALYDLSTEEMTFEELRETASDDDGPFGDHLQSCLWNLVREPELHAVMRAVLHEGSCANDWQFYQLRAAGLVRGSHRTEVVPRCGLYEEYFKKRL